MDFKKHFRQELERRYPAEILPEIEKRFAAIYPDISFARTSSNPMDRRLEFCAYFLATIKALEARGAAFEEIRNVCVNIAESSVRPSNAWQRWLRRLPALLMGTPVALLAARIMDAKAGKKGHPDGFLVRMITSPGETNGLRYGFDILECGICTLFEKHQARKYVPILCDVDKLTSTLAGLEMVRTGTIATGAAKCDFRFKIL